MAITGEAAGEPQRSGIALADVVTGKDAAIAILGTLVARARGNRDSRRLMVSLAESARAALINVAQNALVSGEDARRWGNAHPNLVPYQLFSARDRSIVIAVGTDEQWRACLRVLGLRRLASDPGLATNRGRVSRRQEVIALFEQALGERSATEWVGALGHAGVPCGVVKTVLEVIEETRGASPLTGMPSSVGGSTRIPPPRLDEQGDLIRQSGWGAFLLLGS
jgi:crotonobetainyl-CoA:carnitine CoA-transferase CaiB-like acyl-CoA transferase